MVRNGSPGTPLPALTGLRGIAALWVVLYHLQLHGGRIGLPAWTNTEIVGHGWLAVDLFFILSGFVLMYADGRRFEAIRPDPWLRFELRRILRIYPTATAALFLILLLVIADPGFPASRREIDPADFTTAAFWNTLLLATSWIPSISGDWNQPTWSLSVELAGYLAFPILACFANMASRSATALGWGMACIFVLVGLNHAAGRTDANDFGPYGFIRMAFCFSGGIGLARACRLGMASVAGFAEVLALSAVAGLGIACAGAQLMVLALPCCAALILALAVGDGWVQRILSSHLALWLGRISFPLYLVHLIPLLWIEYRVSGQGLGGPALAAVIGAYFAGCLAIADALHRLVEAPTHELARRLRGSRPILPAAGAAAA